MLFFFSVEGQSDCTGQSMLSDQARSWWSANAFFQMCRGGCDTNLIIWSWSNCWINKWKKLVSWLRFWCFVAPQDDGEQGRMARWSQWVVVGAWFQICSLGWTSLARVSSWCYDRRMGDWGWMQRSVGDIHESCYWSVLDCGRASGVHSCRRVSSIQKLPLATLATLIAISM